VVGLLYEQGRIEELRQLTDAGNFRAARALPRLLREQGREVELKQLVTDENPFAAYEWAKLLRDQSRWDDLRTESNAGNKAASDYLRRRDNPNDTWD
jgi:hypothetical protein